MKVLNLAEYIIRHAEGQGTFVTNLKLQKTLYYLQGYSLKKFEEAAFDDDILNWQYGPVAPTAYFAYSSYGADPLESNESVQIEKMRKDQKNLFDKVIDVCLDLSARRLVQMTHEEAPWKETCQNEEITTASIARFFRAHDPLKIEGAH